MTAAFLTFESDVTSDLDLLPVLTSFDFAIVSRGGRRGLNDVCS